MRTQFVNTENTRRLNHAMVALQKRGALEACLLVLDGVPGIGKTANVKRWVAQNQCIYIRAKTRWTASWFMNELIQLLRLEPPHSREKKFALLLRELGSRQNRAIQAGRYFALVIDELDHVSNSKEIMETIRDLSDMLEMPTMLVGMGKVRDHLKRFPQIASRVSQYVRFETASVADVRDMANALCEVKVADDLVEFVHYVSGGLNREILEAISHMESFGRRFDVGVNGLTRADMAGEIIMNDRNTTEPIFVPEV